VLFITSNLGKKAQSFLGLLQKKKLLHHCGDGEYTNKECDFHNDFEIINNSYFIEREDNCYNPWQ